MNKGYWVVAYKSISNESAVKALQAIGSGAERDYRIVEGA